MTSTTTSNSDQIPVSSLAPFLVITFGIAWGIIALYIFLPTPMAAAFGEISGQHPLFYLATYAPAIAALTIILTRCRWSETRRFLGRLLMWRTSTAWYAFLLLGVPLLFYIGALWKGLPLSEMVPVSSIGGYLVALALSAIKGPVEEIGWRGLALPLLQRKMSPLWAGLALGVVWGLWHLPAFFLSGAPQSAWSFTDFFIGTIALSLIATALFNASRGSILLQAVFHLQVINPLWPDAQPYDTIPFVVAALAVVWFNRDAMLRGTGAVTHVVPPLPAAEADAPVSDRRTHVPAPGVSVPEGG